MFYKPNQICLFFYRYVPSLTPNIIGLPAPTEEEKSRQANLQLWTTELSDADEPEQEPLPAPHYPTANGPNHGYYGPEPILISAGDQGMMSKYRQQFPQILNRAYTLAPTLMGDEVERHLDMNIEDNIFNSRPIHSSTGFFQVPSHVQWGYEVQTATKLRGWLEHFSRFGIVICHRIAVPSAKRGHETETEKQVTLTNPVGETVIWNDAENEEAKYQMAAPIRTMLADPRIFKIDCETDQPGIGYMKTNLPNTVSAPAFYRLYFPVSYSDEEDFARHWLKEETLYPKPTLGTNASRFMYSAQTTKLTILAILKQLRLLYLVDQPQKKLNLIPILRDAIATLLSVECPETILAKSQTAFRIPRGTNYRKTDSPHLTTIYRLLDTSDIVIRAADITLPTKMMPPKDRVHLSDPRSCAQYAEHIWKKIPLPIPSTIARVGINQDFPHFCATCGDPMHRQVHCKLLLDAKNRCAYPLCARKTHLTKVCPALHHLCKSCGRRGHDRSAHVRFTPMQLDALFYWWSPLGVYTCIVFLEISSRRPHIQDWHWKLSLHGVQRNIAQMAFPTLGFNYSALPEYVDICSDRTLKKTHIWLFAPNLRERVSLLREQEVRRLEKEAQKKQAKQEARALKEAHEKEAEALKAQEEATKLALVQEASMDVAPNSVPPTQELTWENCLVADIPPPSEVPIVDATTEFRLNKYVGDVQLAHLVANQLGEPNSAPVVHAQSQSNLMLAIIMELQTCRKERQALEEQNRILIARDNLRAQQVLQMQAAIEFCHEQLGLASTAPRTSPFERLGPTPVPSAPSRPRSPPADMAAELSVDRGITEQRRPEVAAPTGKRQRQRATSIGAARGRNNANKQSLDRSVAPKKSRFYQDAPQDLYPSSSLDPTPSTSQQPSYPNRGGKGTASKKYRGKNYDPNYGGRNQKLGGRDQTPHRGGPKGRGNSSFGSRQ